MRIDVTIFKNGAGAAFGENTTDRVIDHRDMTNLINQLKYQGIDMTSAVTSTELINAMYKAIIQHNVAFTDGARALFFSKTDKNYRQAGTLIDKSKGNYHYEFTWIPQGKRKEGEKPKNYNHALEIVDRALEQLLSGKPSKKSVSTLKQNFRKAIVSAKYPHEVFQFLKSKLEGAANRLASSEQAGWREIALTELNNWLKIEGIDTSDAPTNWAPRINATEFEQKFDTLIDYIPATSRYTGCDHAFISPRIYNYSALFSDLVQDRIFDNNDLKHFVDVMDLDAKGWFTRDQQEPHSKELQAMAVIAANNQNIFSQGVYTGFMQWLRTAESNINRKLFNWTGENYYMAQHEPVFYTEMASNESTRSRPKPAIKSKEKEIQQALDAKDFGELWAIATSAQSAINAILEESFIDGNQRYVFETTEETRTIQASTLNGRVSQSASSSGFSLILLGGMRSTSRLRGNVSASSAHVEYTHRRYAFSAPMRIAEGFYNRLSAPMRDFRLACEAMVKLLVDDGLSLKNINLAQQLFEWGGSTEIAIQAKGKVYLGPVQGTQNGRPLLRDARVLPVILGKNI